MYKVNAFKRKTFLIILLTSCTLFTYSQKVDSVTVKKSYKICFFLSYSKKGIGINILDYIKKTNVKLYERIKVATTSYDLKIDSASYYCVYLGKKIIPYNKLEDVTNKPIKLHLIEYSYLYNGKREKTYLIDEK